MMISQSTGSKKYLSLLVPSMQRVSPYRDWCIFYRFSNPKSVTNPGAIVSSEEEDLNFGQLGVYVGWDGERGKMVSGNSGLTNKK